MFQCQSEQKIREKFGTQIKKFLDKLDFLQMEEVYLYGSVLFKEHPKDIDLLIVVNKHPCQNCNNYNLCDDDEIHTMAKKQCNIYKLMNAIKESSLNLDVKVTGLGDSIPEFVTTITSKDVGFYTFIGKDFFCGIEPIERFIQ